MSLMLCASRRIDAGMHQDAVQPAIEPIWITECRQGLPGSDQGLLDSVLAERAIVEDQCGRGVQAIETTHDEVLEGATIALLRESHC
jgi:hypothetical protein